MEKPEQQMPTKITLDEKLVNEAQKLGKHKTKTAAVTEALKEYIQRRKQQQIFDLFGQIDYDLDYDYKFKRNNH